MLEAIKFLLICVVEANTSFHAIVLNFSSAFSRTLEKFESKNLIYQAYAKRQECIFESAKGTFLQNDLIAYLDMRLLIHYLSVRPTVRKLQNQATISAGRNCGLAE